MLSYSQQECIPVGCVLRASVAIPGGCLPRGGGCLPRGRCLPGVVSVWGVSACDL